MQVLDSNFVACWKQQYWAPLSWGSMEFSTFLVFAVWTASMTDLTFGKGELQNANHFLPLYSCFSPCYLISYHSLFVFRWFTTVDALSNEKTKNLNSTNMTSKGRNLTLENLFCKHWMIFERELLLWWAISQICSCYKKTKNGYDEELLHSKPFQAQTFHCCLADGNSIICMEEKWAAHSQL